MKPGVYSMAESEYHSDPCDEASLSASVAKILLTSTPMHARLAHPKLNPDYMEEAEKKFDFGTACHSLILEGVNKIRIIDAENWRTNAAKAARDEARAAGLIPMLAHESEGALAMCEAAKLSIEGNEDLRGISLADGKPEQVIIWFDEEFGIWCRCRIDWLANSHVLLLDLKTTAKSASPSAWSKAMLSIGADLQAAFYIRAVKAINQAADPKFVFMVQECEPPYAASFIGMNPAFIALGKDKVEMAMRIWAGCLARNEWPGYANRIYWPDPPVFAQAAWNEIFELLTA